jgi:iron complex outermembrane receptor protein
VNWILGYNWYREDLSESDHNWSAPVSNATLAGSSNGIDPLNSTDHASQGVFGQATWAATEQLNITAGARYSKDEVVRQGTFAPGPGPWKDPTGAPCVAPNDCVGVPNNGTQSDGKMTYRLGFDYHLDERSMVYGSVATGYKAGGFNDFDPSTNGTAPYDPESLTAYEAGYKGRLAPGLTLDSAVYYYDYSGSQVSSLVNINGNFVIYTRLVPTKIKGWENELSWRPSNADTINASLALSSSEYVRFNAGLLQNVNWSGKSLDKTPDVTASLSYAHDWDLPNGGTLTAQAATRYSSGYLVSNFVQAVQIEQDAFTRTDANVTYVSPGGKLTVTAFVKNIEDELQILGAPGTYAPANLNLGSAAASEPRFMGVRLGVEF